MALEETLEPVCAEIYASIVDGGGLPRRSTRPRALVDAAHGHIRRDVRNAPAFLAVVDELLATRAAAPTRAAAAAAARGRRAGVLIYGSAAEGPQPPPPARGRRSRDRRQAGRVPVRVPRLRAAVHARHGRSPRARVPRRPAALRRRRAGERHGQRRGRHRPRAAHREATAAVRDERAPRRHSRLARAARELAPAGRRARARVEPNAGSAGACVAAAVGDLGLTTREGPRLSSSREPGRPRHTPRRRMKRPAVSCSGYSTTCHRGAQLGPASAPPQRAGLGLLELLGDDAPPLLGAVDVRVDDVHEPVLLGPLHARRAANACVGAAARTSSIEGRGSPRCRGARRARPRARPWGRRARRRAAGHRRRASASRRRRRRAAGRAATTRRRRCGARRPREPLRACARARRLRARAARG